MPRLRKDVQKRASATDAPNGVHKTRKRGRPRKYATEAERTAAKRKRKLDRDSGAPADLGSSERVLGLGPQVTIGESPIDPTPLPPPRVEPKQTADQGDTEGSPSSNDSELGEPLIDDDALTPEWLVDTLEEIQITVGLVYCATQKREWNARAQAACTYSHDQKARLLIFAPSALPYVAPWIKNKGLIGCGLFAFGVIRGTAEMFGRLRDLPQVDNAASEPGTPPASSDVPREPADVPFNETTPRWNHERANGIFPKEL